MMSSLKKVDKLFGVRENLGSLIFETPQKGSAYSNDHSRYFYEDIEVSPTPFKFGLLD